MLHLLRAGTGAEEHCRRGDGGSDHFSWIIHVLPPVLIFSIIPSGLQHCQLDIGRL
jgi:hypothetical protein